MFTLLAAVSTLAIATPAPSPSPSPIPSVSVPAPVPAASASSDPKTIVVTSAQRRDTPLSQAVKPTQVIDKGTIERFGYDTIADALANLPGEQPLIYGAFGAQGGYGSMGAVGNGMLVLLNGQPITEGSDGEIDIGMLSTAGVSRIEVVQSGGSTVYGSGAAGGTINIVTAVPSTEYLEAAIGSFGDRQIRLEAGNGIVGATFERHIATNDYPYGPVDGFAGGIRNGAEALQTDGSLEYGQTLGDYKIRATARLTKLDLNTPGELNDLTPGDFDASNRNDVSLDVTRARGNAQTDLSLSGLRNDGDFGPNGALYDGRVNVSLKETIAETHRDALVAGVDLSRENSLDFLGSFGPPDEFAEAQSQSAVYGQQSFGIGPSGNGYAGLRAEHDSPAGSILAPGFGISVPAGPLKVGGNVGTSFVVPTLFDLYFPMYSNPNLLPERDQNVDIEIGDPTIGGEPSLKLFDRNTDNLITSNAAFVPINAGRAHFQGATFQFSDRPTHRISLNGSITDLWTKEQQTNGLASEAGYDPTFAATFQIERSMGQKDGIAFGAVAHLNSAHVESGVTGDYGGYTTADAYAKFRAAQNAFVTFRLKNLGNDHYSSYYGFPLPGRSYNLEFSTR